MPSQPRAQNAWLVYGRAAGTWHSGFSSERVLSMHVGEHDGAHDTRQWFVFNAMLSCTMKHDAGPKNNCRARRTNGAHGKRDTGRDGAGGARGVAPRAAWASWHPEPSRRDSRARFFFLPSASRSIDSHNALSVIASSTARASTFELCRPPSAMPRPHSRGPIPDSPFVIRVSDSDVLNDPHPGDNPNDLRASAGESQGCCKLK
mmetsp:Transcript_801/g.2199  ORF Transcript_801/g.2199 Transcript_801/m.2199 type:complete len:204 (-) Transcript_801:22-633(-)